ARPMTSRLSPIIVAQQAAGFLTAAQHLFGLKKPRLAIPAYFLSGRSIELTLKAFLLLKGYSESRLRGISHNLERALEEATASGLHSIVSPPAEQIKAIKYLNPHYN